MGWIRIESTLTWHRKLIDLRTRLGEPLAEAYLQRLWLWCGDNASDGVIRSLDPASAVATAVQWKNDASVLMSALVDCGWIERDPDGTLRVHGWEEHNGKYIKKAQSDAKRARKNREAFKKRMRDASANGSRTVRKQSADESGNGTETERDGTGRNGSVDKPLSASGLRALWNSEADARLARWSSLKGDRGTHAAARVVEHPDPEFWRQVIRAIAKSPGLLGANKRKWRADPDFLVRPGIAEKVLEGKYENWNETPGSRANGSVAAEAFSSSDYEPEAKP